MAVRLITGNFDYEDTKISYSALSWLTLEELAIWKTIIMAKKLLQRQDPKTILRTFAKEGQEGWIVNNVKEYRTEIGRRAFSSRVERVWQSLSDDAKKIIPTTRKSKDILQREIKTMNKEWILWGIKTDEQETGIQEVPDSTGWDDRDDNDSNENGNEAPPNSHDLSGNTNLVGMPVDQTWTGNDMMTLALLGIVEVEKYNAENIDTNSQESKTENTVVEVNNGDINAKENKLETLTTDKFGASESDDQSTEVVDNEIEAKV